MQSNIRSMHPDLILKLHPLMAVFLIQWHHACVNLYELAYFHIPSAYVLSAQSARSCDVLVAVCDACREEEQAGGTTTESNPPRLLLATFRLCHVPASCARDENRDGIKSHPLSFVRKAVSQLSVNFPFTRGVMVVSHNAVGFLVEGSAQGLWCRDHMFEQLPVSCLQTFLFCRSALSERLTYQSADSSISQVSFLFTVLLSNLSCW